MFKVILRFSQHNDNAGICYLREATPNTRRQTGSTAILEKSAAESLEPDLSLPPPGSSGLSSSLCAWVPVSHGPSRLDAHHGSRRGAGLHRAIFQVSAGTVSWTGKGIAMRGLVASRGGSLREVPVRFPARIVEVGHAHAHKRHRSQAPHAAECRGLVPVARHLAE